MNSRTILLTLLVMAAALVTLAATSVAQTDPPVSGEWVIQDNTFWDGSLTMTGNITVNNSGALRLDNITLTMHGATDGQLTIRIEAGSNLELVNVNVKSSSADRHYWFVCEGKVVIDRSDVRDVAANTKRWNSWEDIAGGVQIYDGASVLKNSAFHDSQRINVYVSGCSPIIDNCDFYNAEYVNTYN